MNRSAIVSTIVSAIFAIHSLGEIASAQTQPAPSPAWVRAMPSGPLAGMKITENYAALVARDAYFWAWPLVNMYKRRLNNEKVPGYIKSGPVLAAPINHLAMFTDYADPNVRLAAHPNQDVVYGVAQLALDRTPVVIQVPDFGDRFWVLPAYDTRTDNCVQLGKMYATTPGYYLLVPPGWQGETPKGITRIFRCSTNSVMAAPRVLMDDTPEDRKAVQPVLREVMIYPLSEFDGSIKRMDWSKIPETPAVATTDEELKWVVPETFFDELPATLADAPPLPGEEARYAQVLAVPPKMIPRSGWR
jgi:hypothetical protein